MDDVFPIKEDVDYTKLILTEEGKYSVTRRKDADKIMNIIKKTIGDVKTKSITDATGCVGGDSINFGLNFKLVHSIELNVENFKALINNVTTYKLQNVVMHQGDSTVLFDWKSDVLYIDPPWGGPDYKTKADLDLFISSKRIDEWLEEILIRKNRPEFIFLKLPQNFNFKRLNFLPNIEIIEPHRIRSYILVAITVHLPQN